MQTKRINLILILVSILSFKIAIAEEADTVESLWPVETSYIGSILIDRPVKVIWPYLLTEKQGDWTPHNYYSVVGEMGTLGAVFKSHARDEQGSDVPYPVFRYKIIKLVPYQHYIFSITIQQSKNAPEEFVGYDIFLTKEFNGKTEVTLIQPVKHGFTADIVKVGQEQKAFLDPLLRDLKDVVESRH